MKPTARENSISFSDALHIFWDWRLASISVEISFFGKSKSSETVRVSIDGLVTLVDPEGIITVSGDGREIELDLRGCEFARARKTRGNPEVFNALDPDSVLQVNFPNGEVCLVFPYRRVAQLPAGQRRAENGLEWLENKLASSTGKNGLTYAGLKASAGSRTGPGARKAKRPGKRIGGVPLFPVLALVLAVSLVVLALVPISVPMLLSEMGLTRVSLSDPGAQVWVIRQVGNYYCHGGVLFGREPGELMKQSDALTLGYQPATGHYCGGADSAASSGGGHGAAAYIRNLAQSGRLLFSFILARSRAWLSHSNSQVTDPSLSSVAPGAGRAASRPALRGDPSSSAVVSKPPLAPSAFVPARRTR
jgi:hypothetical protein